MKKKATNYCIRFWSLVTVRKWLNTEVKVLVQTLSNDQNWLASIKNKIIRSDRWSIRQTDANVDNRAHLPHSWTISRISEFLDVPSHTELNRQYFELPTRVYLKNGVLRRQYLEKSHFCIFIRNNYSLVIYLDVTCTKYLHTL